MDNLLAARSQMAMSLGFHIIFAIAGIAMPAFMAVAEWRWLRTKDPVYRMLAKRWARGTAILFAVGAVSGTVLSFELGLLWPEFMKYAGAIIGMPFSLEGFAFFTEAIFLGIYLYGWERVRPKAHLAAGVIVAVSGAASAFFVVCANGWMNTPAGFRMENGKPVDIQPLAAMFNPAAMPEVVHMLLAAYAAGGFAVAGIHAWGLRKDSANAFHRKALAISLSFGAAASILQPISGDRLAKMLAGTQPVKLAAMEGQFQTERSAPLRIGGWPDEARSQTPFAIEVPKMLSFLAKGDPQATVRGLTDFPREHWPPVAIVHIAFQIMVGAGLILLALSLWAAWLKFRGRPLFSSRGFLRSVIAASPLGFIAVEAGWTVTEVGRQPWIIQGVMLTRDAVTPMPGLVIPFAVFTAIYLGLAAVVVVMLVQQIRDSPGVATRRGE